MEMIPAAVATKWMPPAGGWNWSAWLAELAGTAALLLIGLSAVTFDFAPGSPVALLLPSHSLRLLLTGAVFGATGSLYALTRAGRISGAHLNPCLTLAFAITGHVPRSDLAGYAAGQFLGAALGTFVAVLIWGGRLAAVHFGATEPGQGVPAAAAVLIELAMTAALVGVIFLFTSSPSAARWTPAAVWAVVALFVWRFAPLTGTSMNPARTLGPALVSHRLHSLWIYFVGPPLGALAIAAAARLSGGRRIWPRTAKLFHDPRLPSHLGTTLRAANHPAGERLDA